MRRLLPTLVMLVGPATAAVAQPLRDAEICQTARLADRVLTLEGLIFICTRAIESDELEGESLVRTLNSRGLVYDSQGQFDLAIADYERAIRLLPGDPAAYVNRADALVQKGEFEAALPDYDEAIRLDSRLAVAFNNRGNAYALHGDQARAIADYDEAIRLDPAYAEAYINRGAALCDAGEPEAAIRDYDEALRLNPGSVQAFNNRGNVYAELGRYARAIDDYDRAITLHPDFGYAYYNRGRALSALGRGDEAMADFLTQWLLTPGEIAADQQSLADKGFYEGPVDGVANAATVRALQAWVAAGAP